MSGKNITCDLLRERYETLSQQQETCSRLLVTKGPLSGAFIDAFRVFEEKRRRLRKLIEKRKEENFFVLQDLFLRNRKDPKIQKIFDRFTTEKEALAYIFRCRKNQITETDEEILSGESVFHTEDVNLEDLPPGVPLPRYIDGSLRLWETEALSVFPEYVGEHYIFPELRIFPENTVFQVRVAGNFNLTGLKNIPKGTVFPEYIDWQLYLNSLESTDNLKEALENTKYIRGGIALPAKHRRAIKRNPDTIPEHLREKINWV